MNAQCNAETGTDIPEGSDRLDSGVIDLEHQ